MSEAALFDTDLRPSAAAKCATIDVAPGGSSDGRTPCGVAAIATPSPLGSEAAGSSPARQVSSSARWSDPSTSYDNGHTENKARSYAWVLGCLARQRTPITDEHLHALALAEGCKWSEARTRSARAEVVRAGKAVCADREGRTRMGRPAQRWQITGGSA